MLDTHILIWLASGDERLRPSSIDTIEKAAQRRELRLSVITLWEIGYLQNKGRLNLSTDMKTYWKQTLERLFAQEVLITADDIIECHMLPEKFHGDPGDRFLVAQAKTRGMRLMTADAKIITFADHLAPAVIYAAD